MSDGPHRSLPMRPWWRQAALRADRSSFDLEECTEAIEVALEREFVEELRPTFVRALRDAHQQPGLFSFMDSVPPQELNAETPLERRVLANVAVLSADEAANMNGFLSVLANAIRNEVPRFSRQIEEHYLRKSGRSHARRERERLDEATARADIETLARRLLKPDRSRPAAVLKKKSGLDDGVRL